MSAAEDLYRQALALPEEERRRLARKLAVSLAAEPEALDAETIAELERRDVAMETGADPGVSWGDMRAELAASRASRSEP
jgi:putative addiction module component (TIGR02574 family)